MTYPSANEQLIKRRLAARLGLDAAQATRLPRRLFLKLGGLGGLTLAWACTKGPDKAPASVASDEMAGGAPGAASAEAPPAPTYDLNAYVRIAADDSIMLYIGQSDMGQGVLTSLPMIIAEELDVDWAKVLSAHPIASQAKYGFQFTVGSTSVSSSYMTLRQMGAAARQMLLAAAAQRWSVPLSELRTELGTVLHDPSGQRASYGQLAELAATLDAPQNPALKQESAFRIIGTERSQLSARIKAEGKAQYTLDVKVDGMLVGLVARPPDLGGSVLSFDDTATRQVPGVRDVVQIPSGVAVLADHFWAARKGRDVLSVQWQPGPNAAVSTTALRTSLIGMAGQGESRTNDGTPDQVFASAADDRKLDVVYQL
ncbi:MAG TPA: molybdopterin cofactor-binding domain-containing protein, partial [Polyangiaceae bacterium]|nr:molybdopterin cofactor-binding domain-containing protein [Polyangiaceae bacterium]